MLPRYSRYAASLVAVLTSTLILPAAENTGPASTRGKLAEATRSTTPEIDPASGEGQAALGRMKLPAGLTAHLWAAEPMLANPVAFALDEPRKTAIMIRNSGNSTLRDQPLNQGVTADMNAAVATGRLRREAQQSGVRFWLGLCQVLMANVIERRTERAEAARRLEDMLVLGLSGLGIAAEDAAEYASASARGLIS